MMAKYWRRWVGVVAVLGGMVLWPGSAGAQRVILLGGSPPQVTASDSGEAAAPTDGQAPGSDSPAATGDTEAAPPPPETTGAAPGSVDETAPAPPEGTKAEEGESITLSLPPLTDEQLDKMRNALAQNPTNQPLREALAEALIRKATSQPKATYPEIEHFFLEASDLAPENFTVQYVWGDVLYTTKNYEAAVPHLETALTRKPEHLDVLMKLGLCQQKLMKHEEAAAAFERARALMPDDFFVLYSLGRCHYELKDFEKAIEFWEAALTKTRNPGEGRIVQQLIAQAREQDASISGTTKDENQRFIIHYAGNSQRDIGDVTLEILEDIYDQVTSDLEYKPDIKINVIFFLTQEFYLLNNAANWVGAMAKGEKILVPLRQGYANMTNVKGTLAHEFTHVIVNLRTNNRCPVWINEGIAQWEEFQAAFGDPLTLRGDYQKLFETKVLGEKQYIPVSQINLNPAVAVGGDSIPMGYLISYLSIRFFIERWAMAGVVQMLESIGQGNHPHEALNAVTGLTLPEFEKEFADWLTTL